MDVREYTPGQQLPGTVYRVVRHLATGGMGSVYDVEDITVGKRYVLKTLHPQLVNRKDLAKRMEAEARALAKLQHPNIVDVFTAGVTSDAAKMPFYVMERLNGQNLRVVIDKKGALEITHAYRIATDVLDALEQAHENGIIHRDVKPENIFLHRNVNGTTITKLLDFGIMRLLDKKASHTQGKFIGTLRYASPEQIFGGDLGPSSDIYSLGVVLYEMLAGRGPFDELSDAYAIGAAHAQRPPPPLSTFVRVPMPLERLVMSALGKTPSERPRDCFTFASELRRLLREEEAAPPKSATEIALVSAAPPTRDDAYAGTEASSPPPQRVASGYPPHQAGPNALAPTGGIPSTRREAPGSFALPPDAAQRPAHLALAATVASQPGPSGPPPPPERPMIDRAAETRMSAPQGSTMRMGQNGTAVEEPIVDRFDPAAHVGVLVDVASPASGGRARVGTGPQARAVSGSVSAPPAAGPPSSGRNDTGGDLRFPPQGKHAEHGGTGPLAGEASTRPPERSGMLGPLLGAAFFGMLIVGAAVFLAMHPEVWRAAAPAPTITPNAATTAAAPQTAGSALPTAAAASASAKPVIAASPASTPAPAAPTTDPPAAKSRGGSARPPAPVRVDPPAQPQPQPVAAAPVAVAPAASSAAAPKPHAKVPDPSAIPFD